MSEKIENLMTQWEDALLELTTAGEYSIEVMEPILRESYRLCTEYKNANLVPKELCKIFVYMNNFRSALADACDIDELSTPSDAAEYDAVAYIIDEIECGFYSGNYESAFPSISVESNECKSYVLNLEEAFLEYFIDENR